MIISQAQDIFYRDNPFTQKEKACTGRAWMVRVVGELLQMVLKMWTHRCGCLHGHDKQEKKLRQKEVLGSSVAKCYEARHTIASAHQDIFNRPLEDTVTSCTTSYLQAWMDMFYTL